MTKIAIFLPEYYNGRILNEAKNISKAIAYQATLNKDDIKVVFSCVKNKYNLDLDFEDLYENGISVRETDWITISKEKIKEIGNLFNEKNKFLSEQYALPSDGANDFLDCDLWIIITGGIKHPIYPIKKYICMNYNSIHGYVPNMIDTPENSCKQQINTLIPFFRNAEFVIVDTPSKQEDILSFAGIKKEKTILMGLNFDPIYSYRNYDISKYQEYFVWDTNSDINENHKKIIDGLIKYYEKYNGRLKTVIIGDKTDVLNPCEIIDSSNYENSSMKYFEQTRNMIKNSKILRANIHFEGNISDSEYVSILKGAKFLLHTNLYENETKSVIEAAYFGTPSLCSKYPSMEYINDVFKLNINFFNPYDTNRIAESLYNMESTCEGIELPLQESFEQFNWKNRSNYIYTVIKKMI